MHIYIQIQIQIYTHTHTYKYVCVCITPYSLSIRVCCPAGYDGGRRSEVGLYTTLLLPILYGVWHTKGGREGVVYCAIDVRWYCNSASNAGGRGR